MHPQYHHRFEDGRHHYSQSGPSGTQVLAVITLLPLGGMLLALAGLTLAGTVIGMLISIPLFLIFSPVIVPAAIVLRLAVAGFLASGAFGLTGLSSLSYVKNRVRRVTGAERYTLDQAKDQAERRVTDMADYVG
ncbi:hypothetical protein SLEP1_g45303 [Rubroshorea leprosula]|uniref:Oleosin n=1 Tax=Rubroshorea leprosula TaxID=152421 RepID=A0AAV5LIR5_9ROSI|nr:hypothetical protein SLEP1_g45303 [Rubroshorea leprosula]